MARLQAEQIYDAAFDDDALAALSGQLTEELGARSTLIHWIHRDGATDILSHSGYFSEEQLAIYARDYAALDPWVHATSSSVWANRVIDLEQLVPTKDYVRSTIYNDFIRPIGDDTARCVGIRLQNDWGAGFVSLQRGLGQNPFEQSTLDGLHRIFPHIRKMLSVRGRMAAAQQQARSAIAALDSLANPVLLVNANMQLKVQNAAAERLLRTSPILRLEGGQLCLPDAGQDGLLRSAIASALSPNGGATAVGVHGATGQRLNMSITPTAAFSTDRLAMIIVEVDSSRDKSRASRLQALHGLSASEAFVALMLADGHSPAEIADLRQVAIGTVRVHIKRIAAKLGCSRQGEIVRIVANLPLLAYSR